MKRIAVLISGLPRFSTITTDMMQSIAEQFVDYRVDWFFYLWNPEGKPEKYVHESWSSLNLSKVKERLLSKIPSNHYLADIEIGVYKGEYQDPSLMMFESCGPQFLSLLRADYLRQKKEREEGFLYDVVIRSRPDIRIEGNIDKYYHPNTILVERIEWWAGRTPTDPSCVQDKFAAGRGEDMTEYTNMLEHIQSHKHMFLEPPNQTEILLACHLKMRGKTPFTKSNFTVCLYRPTTPDDFNGWTD
jgi:hypothetical protein